MRNRDHSAYKLPSSGSFWRSRAGIVLITSLIVAGLLLAYEHRVHMFTETGFLVALLALCIGAQRFVGDGRCCYEAVHTLSSRKRGRL